MHTDQGFLQLAGELLKGPLLQRLSRLDMQAGKRRQSLNQSQAPLYAGFQSGTHELQLLRKLYPLLCQP